MNWCAPSYYQCINQRKIKCNYQFINQWVTESLDHFAICMEGRQDLQKSIKSEHFNASCANGHCNSASEKVVKHKDECSARWIFQKWQPQPLEDLKFVKSWKLSENWNLNPFSEMKFLKVYKHMFFRSKFAHKLLIYALIITFYFPLIYALIIRGRNGGCLSPHS